MASSVGTFAIKGAKSSARTAENSVGFTLTGGRWDVVTRYDGRLKAGAMRHGGRFAFFVVEQTLGRAGL